MNNNIVWKDIMIDGIITNYEVNNIGQVRNKKNNKILLPELDKYGYCVRNININGKQYLKKVHRLVAQAFIPNPENKPQINHRNGIKTDNRVENLEWATQTENIQHAYRTGLAKGKSGIYNSMNKYSEEQIHLICKLLEKKIPMKLISKLINFNYKLINEIKNGHKWKHIFSQYNIDRNYDSKSGIIKKIKYSKLKKILIELNIFDNIDLYDLLDSKYITHKNKLIDDLIKQGYEIFIDSKLYMELYNNDNKYIK